MFSDLDANDQVSASLTLNQMILFTNMSHLQWKTSAACPARLLISPLRLVPEGTSWDGGDRHYALSKLGLVAYLVPASREIFNEHLLVATRLSVVVADKKRSQTAFAIVC